MTRGPRTEGFSARHRFSARGSFGAALRSPSKLRGANVVLSAVHGQGAVTRLGIALTRRMVRRAVDRNRLKRIIRDEFRHHLLKNRGLDCVVALRKPFDAGYAVALRGELRQLFDQLAAR